jgi:hypothetical protein
LKDVRIENRENNAMVKLLSASFSKCSNLEEFWADKAEVQYCFDGCSNLKYVRFGEVGKIYGGAINISSMKELYIEELKGPIENSGIGGANVERVVILNSQVPTFATIGINLPKTVKLYVPTDLVDAWKTTLNAKGYSWADNVYSFNDYDGIWKQS